MDINSGRIENCNIDNGLRKATKAISVVLVALEMGREGDC